MLGTRHAVRTVLGLWGTHQPQAVSEMRGQPASSSLAGHVPSAGLSFTRSETKRLESMVVIFKLFWSLVVEDSFQTKRCVDVERGRR